MFYFYVSKREVASWVMREVGAKFYGFKGKAWISDAFAMALENVFTDLDKDVGKEITFARKKMFDDKAVLLY